MRATITRTGGFAGVTLRREVELSDEELDQLRQHQHHAGTPDSFSYDVTVNGETFTVRGGNAERLLATLLRGD